MRSMCIESVEALVAQKAADAGQWDLREALRDYPKPLFMPVADPSDSVILPADLAFVRAHGSAFEKFAAASAGRLKRKMTGIGRSVARGRTEAGRTPSIKEQSCPE